MLRLIGTTVDMSSVLARLSAAEKAAADADAKAANARTMVLNRDPTLAALSDAAAQLPVTQQAAAVEHQAIRDLITALTARVGVLEGNKTTVGFGSTTVSGSLLAGATTNVVVTFDKTFTASDYSLGYSIEGGASLLGTLVINGVTTRARNSVTLQLRNTGLTAIANLTGATVHAVAARVAP